MNIFETVKAAVTLRQAADHYGLKTNRSGMVCCPFHDDRHPSMKLNEDYFYCFGCGATGDVVEFTDRTYFEEHTAGTLYLPDSTYSITLFACVEADAYDQQIYNTSAVNGEGTGTLLDYIEEQAAQYRDIGMTEDDRIIGLSTCAEAETNGRVIVFGRLDPMNEIQEGGA